jgi:hypothetical protein
VLPRPPVERRGAAPGRWRAFRPVAGGNLGGRELDLSRATVERSYRTTEAGNSEPTAQHGLGPCGDHVMATKKARLAGQV